MEKINEEISYNNLIRQFSLDKTLCFELKPQGKTMSHIEEYGFLESDKNREECYQQAKELMDDYYIGFTQNVLSEVDINWSSLVGAYYNAWEEGDRKKLEKQQKEYCKKISELFTEDKRYKVMFGATMIDKTMPHHLVACGMSDKLDVFKAFNKFSTYFTRYFDTKKRIFSADAKSGTIAYRIVCENFPMYLKNLATIERINELDESIISSASVELKVAELSDYFEIEEFNRYLSQKGIDFYNYLIVGESNSSTETSIKGINQLVNEYSQKNPDRKLSKKEFMLKPLFKQILSKKDKPLFVQNIIENDQQLHDNIVECYGRVKPQIDKIETVVSNISDYELDRIYVDKNKVSKLSSLVFGQWFLLDNNLKEEFEPAFKTKKKFEAFLKSNKSMEVLVQASENLLDRYFERIKQLKVTVNETFNAYVNIIPEAIEKGYYSKNYNAANKLKKFLDSYVAFAGAFRIFAEDTDTDTEFYAVLNECLATFKEMNKLYDKARNYITKKNEVKKLKLNFDNSTLASGWSDTKLDTNATMILKKDEGYYLGIINRCNKPNLTEMYFSDSENYEKLSYKFTKDITLTVPKCSTQTKAVISHFASEDSDFVLDTNKFKKPLIITKEIFDLNNVLYDGVKKFQKDYLRNTGDEEGFKHALLTWINFCKEFLSCYSGTADYDLSSVKSAEKYESLDRFYEDVNKLLFEIKFEKVSKRVINEWVSEGKLLLFKISCKDFGDKATGKKDLNTMYWEAIFTEENLKNNIFKLNGGAEIYFRPASKNQTFKHNAGEIMVNKHTKDGRTIPGDIYKELAAYANKKISKLSAPAKEYYDDSVSFVAGHDYIKDKRFMSDKILFHCPITINAKESSNTTTFNNRINRMVKEDEGINILAISRGEDSILSMCLLDRKGNILIDYTKNLRYVNGIDYRSKLEIRRMEMINNQKDWKSAGRIKSMIQGYLSHVIKEVAHAAIKNNAIIVMEDREALDKGKFEIDKTIYENFCLMLINKLNYYVDKEASDNGSVLKGYQLTYPVGSISEIGRQCGCVYFVPGTLMKTDVVSGFVNLFRLDKIKNNEQRQEFVSRFKSVSFNGEVFEFAFNYKDYVTYYEPHIDEWVLGSYDTRVRTIKVDGKRELLTIDLTAELKKLFDKYKIAYNKGENILPDIIAANDSSLINELYTLFCDIIQMKNKNDYQDTYFVSPVNVNGVYYDTRDRMDITNYDLHRAVIIANKGLLLIEECINNADEDGWIDYKLHNVNAENWLKWCKPKS